VDPGDEPHIVIEAFKEFGSSPDAVLITHGHFDHFGGVTPIARPISRLVATTCGSLVQPASVPGDRREYWTTPKDVWEVFRLLAEERRRREVDPTLSMLRDTLLAEPTAKNDHYARERMQEMHDLIELLNNWVDEMNRLPPKTLMRLLTLGRKIRQLLDPRQGKKDSTEVTSN